MLFETVLAAPEATAGAAAGSAAAAGGSLISAFALPIIMIAVLYFIMIRPQRKKDKLVKEMLSQLTVGDKILTIGGIHGKITSIKDDKLIIESGTGADVSHIKIEKWAVKEVIKPYEA